MENADIEKRAVEAAEARARLVHGKSPVGDPGSAGLKAGFITFLISGATAAVLGQISTGANLFVLALTFAVGAIAYFSKKADHAAWAKTYHDEYNRVLDEERKRRDKPERDNDPPRPPLIFES